MVVTNRPLVVYASSPSAIDFTALALGSVHPALKHRPRLALIKSEVTIAHEQRKRSFESRFGLPVAHVERDPDRTFRQRFLPIDRIDLKRLRAAVLEMGASYSELVNIGGGRKLADQVMVNTVGLARAVADEFRVAEPSLVRGSTSVIRGAFRLLNIPAEVEIYESLFPRNMAIEDINEVMVLLSEQVRVLELRSGVFVKGGSLDIVNVNEELTIDRLRQVTIDEGSLILEGSGGCRLTWNPLNGPTIYRHSQPVKDDAVAVVLRGPLDLLKVLSRAQLGHLPWYCEVRAPGTLGIEVISPATVVSRVRSGFHTDAAFRLQPSGYTLFDYTGEIVEAFIKGALGPHWTNLQSLSKSRFLNQFIDRYVSQSQTGAKSRSGMGEYFGWIRQRCLQERPRGTLENLREISEKPVDDIFAAPWTFVAWFDVLDYLAGCLNSQSSRKIDASIAQGLDKEDLLAGNDHLAAGKLSERFCTTMLRYESNLAKAGFGTDTVSPIIEEAIKLTRRIQLESTGVGAGYSEINSAIGHYIQRLARLASELLIASGDLAVLWLNTILAANIFSVCILVGADGCIQAFEGLLKKRSGHDFATADPIVVAETPIPSRGDSRHGQP